MIYYFEDEYIEDGFGIDGVINKKCDAKKLVNELNRKTNLHYGYRKIPLLSSDINEAIREINNCIDDEF